MTQRINLSSYFYIVYIKHPFLHIFRDFILFVDSKCYLIEIAIKLVNRGLELTNPISYLYF